MSIVAEIERIKSNIANAYTACEEKGATMPAILNSSNLAECIASITGSEDIRYVKDGLLFNLSGQDSPINNAWVDRVSKNVVTLYNSPVYDSTDKCYSFNGSNQYGAFNLSGADGDFTLEIYYKQDAIGRLDVGVGQSAGNRMGYGIINNNSQNYCWLTSGSTAESRFILPENDRVEQVAGRITYGRVSRQGSTIYFDHKDNARSISKNYDGTSTAISETKYTIAKNGYSSVADTLYSKVKIYAIRVYDRCLTEEEIAQNHAEDVRIYGE